MSEMEREFKSSSCDQSSTATGAAVSRRSVLSTGATVAATVALASTALAQSGSNANGSARPRFQRIPIQYLAVLADPEATVGDNAQEWGLWRKDPGPRGVSLDNYERLRNNNDVAPSQWEFDNSDWWLEENGLIMEAPEFPLSAGQYLVTGDREKQAMLTVHPMGADGKLHWELDNDANIYDVTHLRCRSARYTPEAGAGSCSPAKAQMSNFPVTPGAVMPSVEGCNQQDYAVLIVFAIAE